MVVLAAIVALTASSSGLLYAAKFKGDTCHIVFDNCAAQTGSKFAYANAQGQCLAFSSAPTSNEPAKCDTVSFGAGGSVRLSPLFSTPLVNNTFTCQQAAQWALVRCWVSLFCFCF